jgi:hypothetical protein
MKSASIVLLFNLIMISGCCREKHGINVTVTKEVISTDYIGNGAQWDAYPEAEQWGSSISDADWHKLYKRLDFMKPDFIRCLINSPFNYYDIKNSKYDKTRNIEPLIKLLTWCQENNVTVLFGEFNPPTWEMKQDTGWIEMSVDYLDYLVSDLGFTCIKYFNLFNEPDGDWSATNGDYEMWKNMVILFTEKMKKYPGLSEKVTIAGPDIVTGYCNPASAYQPWEWIKQSAAEMDTLIGLYDIHAYTGQFEVRSGRFAKEIKKYVDQVPDGKRIVLGESGYKYSAPEDSLLMAEQQKRIIGNPFTMGSDCNMMVYDYFYGLDMPLLCMEAMNSGLSGMAVWMLDDAMHSKGDAGNTKDIKLWGMWNILGEEVFSSPEQEDIRPWFYSWSLMCRYFPAGSTILHTDLNVAEGVKVVSGISCGKLTIAMVNTSDKDQTAVIKLPNELNNAMLYLYSETFSPKDSDGFPVPVKAGIKARKSYTTNLPAQSFILLTEIQY